ncbi:ADP-ribosylglycohydrolase family protein [Halomonas elongata]|uniref:ADP-ribosylglycohydrolase family protein n=1 Tax=Halomonas elongata TaxID=2746 RepID=UPI004033C141
MAVPNILSRWQGCLVGLACGDALGAPLEFQPRDRLPPITDMIEGGKFRMQRGEWTDDTAMALCLAESLLARDGFDAADQMSRYWRWANEGENSTRSRAFGIGKTVAMALAHYQKTGDPWSGSTDIAASGNGSIMRLAPVALFYAGDATLALQAEESSRTTHASPLCLASCRLLALLLERTLIQPKSKAAWLDAGNLPHHHYPGPLHPILGGQYRQAPRHYIRSSGYVVDSLEAALWCVWHTETFQDAVLMAANLGDDADTVAAITGQLAGAYYGVERIPETWRNVLFESHRIHQMAKHLLSARVRSLDVPTPK